MKHTINKDKKILIVEKEKDNFLVFNLDYMEQLNYTVKQLKNDIKKGSFDDTCLIGWYNNKKEINKGL